LSIFRTIHTWRRVRETRNGLSRLSNGCLQEFGILRSDIPAVARQLAR
jgi:uncharacterized protein YjiS (DUF1127 family)